MIPHEQLYYTVDLYSDMEEYSLILTIYPHDTIDYSEYEENDKVYASISFSNEMNYSILENKESYIEITLDKGKLLEEFRVKISLNDSVFEEDKEILDSFMSNKDNESLEMRLNLYNPNGIISHSSNINIRKK